LLVDISLSLLALLQIIAAEVPEQRRLREYLPLAGEQEEEGESERTARGITRPGEAGGDDAGLESCSTLHDNGV
jgi:hypothetical protein